MKQFIILIGVLSFALTAHAQSRTTQALQAKFDGSLSLYFYKNTLRMLNQQENAEFDELIKNIEKLKFLMVDKNTKNFGAREYKKLASDYQKESYEPIVTSRFEGRNFDIYLKDAKGSTPGTVVLVNDSTNLFVLDIIGSIDVSKAGALFSMIDNSTDIGKRIRNFTEHKSDTSRSHRTRVKID